MCQRFWSTNELRYVHFYTDKRTTSNEHPNISAQCRRKRCCPNDEPRGPLRCPATDSAVRIRFGIIVIEKHDKYLYAQNHDRRGQSGRSRRRHNDDDDHVDADDEHMSMVRLRVRCLTRCVFVCVCVTLMYNPINWWCDQKQQPQPQTAPTIR